MNAPRIHSAEELAALKSSVDAAQAVLVATEDGSVAEAVAHAARNLAAHLHGVAVTSHNAAIAAHSRATRYVDGDERALGAGPDVR